MLRSYLRQIFWSFVFPGDRPSAVLIAFAIAVNGIVLFACSAAWEAAANGGCTESSQGWLSAGAISDAVHVVFAIYFIVAVRRRAARCDVVPPSLTVARFVLSDYILGVYALFCLWVVVWISVTYASFPIQNCSDDANGGRDLCCVYCTVLSSVNVFYLFGVAAIILCTVITEGFRQPRWWHTILLQDLRRRELQALHEEANPRQSIRANSNRDTDREMRAAGIVVRGAEGLSPQEELRQRRVQHQAPAVPSAHPPPPPGRSSAGQSIGERRQLQGEALPMSPPTDHGEHGPRQRKRLQPRSARRQHHVGVRFMDYAEEEAPAADEPSPLLAGEERHRSVAPPVRSAMAPVVRPSTSVVPVMPGQKKKPSTTMKPIPAAHQQDVSPTVHNAAHQTQPPNSTAALHEDEVGFFIDDDDDDDEEFYIADHDEVLPNFPAERGNI